MAKSYETVYIDGSMVQNCILETDTYWNKMYVFISMVAFFCLPLLVLMLVYWLISRRLIRENVSMMDTTRENLIDNCRLNTRHANEMNDSSMSSSYVSYVFGRHFKGASPRKSLLSLLRSYSRDRRSKSCQGTPDELNHQGVTSLRLNNQRLFNPMMSAQKCNLEKRILTQASEPAPRERGLLGGGKTLSLDYHANGKRHIDDEPIHVSKILTESEAEARSDSRYCWSANTLPQGQSDNFQSSLADAAAATKTTNEEDGVSPCTNQQASSFLGRLILVNSKFVGNLFTRFNLSSKLMVQSEQADNNSVGIGINDIAKDGNATGYKKRALEVGRNLSMTSCDDKIIDYHEYDESSRIERISEKSSFDITDMHSRLVDENDCTVNEDGPDCTSQYKRVDKIHQGEISESNLLIGQCIIKDEKSAGSSRRAKVTSAKRSASSFRDPKRALESNKNRIVDGRGSPRVNSRFKWIKGVSISSSTGSTLTNSTCLASETSSVHNRHQNSPSPPRPVQHQQALVTKEGVIELDHGKISQVCSRENSPEKMRFTRDQRKVDPSEEVNDRMRGTARSHAQAASQRSHSKLDSRSSSTTYNEADNSYCSDGSSSSSLSNAAEFTSTKSSWLESLLFRGQRNFDNALQRRMSQQEDEQTQESNNDLILQTRMRSGQRLFSICLDGTSVGQPLEIVVDEDEPLGTGSSLDSTSKHLDFERTQPSESLSMEARVMKSVDERKSTSNNDADEGKLIALDAVVKRHSHESALTTAKLLRDSGCDVIVSTNPKMINKVNLVTMAHCSTANSQQKISGQRSGSHPIVSCNAQIVAGTGSNALHPDYIAVRDISKKQQMDSRRQVVAMLAFVVACFFLLFFPYRLFTIWLILSTEDQVRSLGMETYYNITYFSRILIYLHSAINPIAYNLISTKFRRAFMSILLCRGAATRRNFNTDNRQMYKSRDHANHNRSKIANGISAKALKAANAPTCT